MEVIEETVELVLITTLEGEGTTEDDGMLAEDRTVVVTKGVASGTRFAVVVRTDDTCVDVVVEIDEVDDEVDGTTEVDWVGLVVTILLEVSIGVEDEEELKVRLGVFVEDSSRVTEVVGIKSVVVRGSVDLECGIKVEVDVNLTEVAVDDAVKLMLEVGVEDDMVDSVDAKDVAVKLVNCDITLVEGDNVVSKIVIAVVVGSEIEVTDGDGDGVSQILYSQNNA